MPKSNADRQKLNQYIDWLSGKGCQFNKMKINSLEFIIERKKNKIVEFIQFNESSSSTIKEIPSVPPKRWWIP